MVHLPSGFASRYPSFKACSEKSSALGRVEADVGCTVRFWDVIRVTWWISTGFHYQSWLRELTTSRRHLFLCIGCISADHLDVLIRLQNLEHPQSCLHWTHQSAQWNFSIEQLELLSTSVDIPGWWGDYEISMQYSGDYPFSPGILILTRIQWTKTGAMNTAQPTEMSRCASHREGLMKKKGFTRHKPSPSHHHRWAIFMAGIWWDFNHPQMVGLHLHVAFRLPFAIWS